MRGAKKYFAILILSFLNLIIGSRAVFAASNLSITLTPSNVELSATPEQLSTTTQTITASTSNESGYTIKMRAPLTTSALTSTVDSSYTIPTFTLPSGSSSLPADSTGYGYGFSLDNGQNFFPIPEPETPAVELFSTAQSGQNTHSLTYGALVPSANISGDYTNTINIYITANLAPCPKEKICYAGNGDDDTGLMEDQTAASNSSVMLIAPNFSRPGYGFAGWNTEPDGSGTTFGPNQTIQTGDLSLVGYQLYARWVESSGTLQGWRGCADLGVGTVVALTDNRDGNTYAVTKHGDNQCWMMENLRLDLSDPDLEISGVNTNRPSADFTHLVNNPLTRPTSTNSFCSNNDSACIDRVLFNSNNTNRSLTASYDSNNTTSSWYSYGNYYNWFTATAGYGTYDKSQSGSSTNGDLCPANWRLPAGAATFGDLSILDVKMGGTGRDQTSGAEGVAGSNRWRNYPMNFIIGGEQRGSTASNRNISSSYATLNASSADRTNNLWLKVDAVYPNGNATPKNRGQTIRCLFNEGYRVNGNIHYEPNGGTGTMSDDENVSFGSALAAENGFTRDHYEFVNWNTSADGKGVVILAGGLVAGAADRQGLIDGDTLILYAIWKPKYSLVYAGNGADQGSMSSADVASLETGTYGLVAPNYSRAGYGFAGWSLDSTASTKLQNNVAVTIYGPNEKITVDNNFLRNADPNTYAITMHAVWIPENNTYTMQTFGATQCSVMNLGESIALKDTRDNNVYTVTKLADHNCWMTENLKLDPSIAVFDDTTTNLPTANFVDAAGRSSSQNTLCAENSRGCIDSVAFNTSAINRSLTPRHNGNLSNNSWYSYGVVYNWYTASAGNGDYDLTTGHVSGDICPAGWRLPTGGASGEYNTLNTLINNSTSSDLGLLKFPANFIYSGDYNTASPGGRGTYGRYWTATPTDNNYAYRFGFNSGNGVTPANSWNKWVAFAVRCIVKGS